MNKKFLCILASLFLLILHLSFSINAYAVSEKVNQTFAGRDEEPNLFVICAVIGVVVATASYRVRKLKSDDENEQENKYKEFDDDNEEI